MTRPVDAYDFVGPAVPEQFPVVAVGASAGGLAPTVELLRELGPRPDVAIVVIHHLDPTHESSLVEIFSRATPLAVVVATDDVRVEPNHVYVLPPNTGLLIQAGILNVVPRVGTGGLHLPINQFFESLALDQESLAIGVVLSGTGFDGTNGIKAIKAHGGITLAQDTTAQYAGMPESAIATGCVDFILPTAGLARELVRLGTNVPSMKRAPQSTAAERDYLQILAAVRKTSGVNFASYRHTTIRRRLERRLFLRGFTELGAYVDLLKRDPTEASALCGDLLIHVTSFFREPEAFEALRAQVLPKLLETRPDATPLRIWVPGCSTGEEVYSIAICGLEFLDEAHRDDVPLKIFGTDLSAVIIEKARAGRFPTSIEADVSPARLQRFFSRDEGGYQVRQDLRDLCVFAKHDVTCDPPFSAMDLISCRNLMIYLGPELQERVIALLHYALNEPGFLVLGSAETVRAFVGFSIVDGKNKIYARTSAAPRLTFDFTTPRLPFDFASRGPVASGSSNSATGWKSGAAPDVHREADRLVLAEFGPPGVVVTDGLAVIQFRGHTGPFLEHVPGVATLDLLRLAREELRLPLRRAIDSARTTQATVTETNLAILVGEQRRTVTLEVIPFVIQPEYRRFFLVLFKDSTVSEGASSALPSPLPPEAIRADDDNLRRELASTRQYLESLIEQGEAVNEELKAANEEIVSSNEELRSTNEELQSAKEELQATNEELRTLNDEMKERTVVATRLSSDLTNVLASVEVPILMVGRDGVLRRFTPAAMRMFGLVAADVGRPVDGVMNIVAVVPRLSSVLSEVLETLHPHESLLQDGTSRWHQLSVRPYLTLDGRVDGTVISVRDVDAEQRIAERLTRAKKYAEGIVGTVRDGLAVFDRDGRVQSMNKAFLHAFRLNSGEIEGRRIDEFGRTDLATPALRKLLDDAAEGADDLRLEQSDGVGGRHVFLVTARRIEDTEFVLLAFADVTESERAAEKIRAYQGDLQRVSFEAAVAEERERRRLAVELHDRIGQALALAQIKLTSVRGELIGEPRTAVDGAVALLEQAIADKRALVFELSPPILYDLGLGEALAWLAEDSAERHGITLEISDDGAEKPMDDITKAIVFRTVRELVMNVLKHAGVTTAKVSLRRTDDQLEILVEDRGVGFDVDAPADRRQRDAFGLLSVREQIARIGGTLTIEAAPRQGTRASVHVPLRTKDDADGVREETA
jgi:two-component system, chemotaxis family, CheB/CheR fusion protein